VEVADEILQLKPLSNDEIRKIDLAVAMKETTISAT